MKLEKGSDILADLPKTKKPFKMKRSNDHIIIESDDSKVINYLKAKGFVEI